MLGPKRALESHIDAALLPVIPDVRFGRKTQSPIDFDMLVGISVGQILLSDCCSRLEEPSLGCRNPLILLYL